MFKVTKMIYMNFVSFVISDMLFVFGCDVIKQMVTLKFVTAKRGDPYELTHTRPYSIIDKQIPFIINK